MLPGGVNASERGAKTPFWGLIEEILDAFCPFFGVGNLDVGALLMTYFVEYLPFMGIVDWVGRQ